MLFVMLEFFISSYYFSLKFFYVDLLFFFKIFNEFIKILLYFMSWLFGIEACGIPVPQPGIKPVPSALEALTLSHWIAREVLYQLSVQFISETHQACPHEALCTCSSPYLERFPPDSREARSFFSFRLSSSSGT